jgi:hypothetical protein
LDSAIFEIFAAVWKRYQSKNVWLIFKGLKGHKEYTISHPRRNDTTALTAGALTP